MKLWKIFFLKKLSKIWHGWPLFWFMCDVIPPNSKLYGEKVGMEGRIGIIKTLFFCPVAHFSNLSIRRIRSFQEKEAASDHLIWYFYWSFAEIYHQTLFLANFLTVCLMTWLPLGTCMYQELQPAELLIPCLIDLCHIWSWKMHATQCLTALWPSWHVTLIYLR